MTPDERESGDNVFRWLVANTLSALQNGLHVVFYGVLALLLVWALERTATGAVRMLIALLVAVTLGAGLEWYQLHVPGRFGSLGDILLNTLGAIVGLAVSLLLF